MTAATDRSQFRDLLAHMAAKATAKLPECTGRIEKAVALLLNHDVDYHPEDGSAIVNSCTDPTKVHHVTGSTCDCQDFPQAPHGFCKHRLSVALLTRVRQRLPPIVAPMATAAESQALPEAAASVNFRAMVGQFECQFTLRGSDENALLERLQALVQRPDVRPLPKPAPKTGGWKPRQGRF
jgi:hypothetical protein